MGRVSGKVAIITGAAMGQGAAEGKLFAREGAKVVLTDIAEERLQQTVKEIREAGGETVAVKHDVSSQADWENVVKIAVDTYGKVDVLVNNAGILSQNGVEETTLEEWNKVMGVNATGVFLGMKAIIPEMRRSGGGSIINISSIYGLIGSGGSAAYQASKGAVRLLTKTAAIQYAKENIRVNSVHPGVIATPMTEAMLEDETARSQLEAVTPLPRLGQPEDIAYGVLYLASDESGFMTGSELVIDGGYTAQ